MKKQVLSMVLALVLCLSLVPMTAQAAGEVKIGRYANDAVQNGEFRWHIILKADKTFELVTGDFEGIYTDTGTWTADSSGTITAKTTNGESVTLTGGGSNVLTLWDTPLYYDATYSAVTAPQSTGQTVNPTASTVYVNGAAKAFEAYNIGGNNFFKLRDLAMVLSGSPKQFAVGYDNATAAISLTSGKPYTAVGGELVAGDGKSKTATPTASKIYLNGTELKLTVYNIGGNNFFKLRDLMKAIDVFVGYDSATSNITVDTSKSYVEEGATPTAPTTPAASTVNLIDTMEPYAYTDLGNYVDYVLWYQTAGASSLTLAGEEYKNALMLQESPATTYASFNLDGKYSQISGKVGMSDAGGRYEDDPPVVLNIYGDDKLLQGIEIKMGALPVDLSVNVSGVKALKFEIAPQTLYRATNIGLVELKLHTGNTGVATPTPTPPQKPNAVNLIDTMEPYSYTEQVAFVDRVLWYPSAGASSLTVAGTEYKNALMLQESRSTTYASFNLDSKYLQISGKVGMSDAGGRYEDDPPVVLNIYGDDKLLKGIEIKMGALPVDFSVDVSGVKALKFEIAPQALYRATILLN
jgi:hypothetical protein